MVLISWNKLSDETTALIKKQLTFQKKNFANPKKPITLTFYEECSEGLKVPLHFAYEHGFWVNPVIEFAKMNPNVKFIGELQETDKRPQKTVFAAVNQIWETSPATIMVMACGGGKSNVGIALAAHQKFRTAILCHKNFLLDQWKERCEQFLGNCKIGRVQQNVCDTKDKDIVLISIPSLTSRKYPIEDMTFGLIIIDEAHHISSPTFWKILGDLNYHYSLALTATPYLGQEQALFYLLGPVAVNLKRVEYKNVQVNVIKHESKQREIKYKNGTVGMSRMITNLTCENGRNKLIVALVLKLYSLYPQRQGLLLSDRTVHLVSLHKLLGDELSAIVCGSINTLKEGEFHDFLTLSTYGLFSEAVDFGGDFLILATPRSEIQQCVGRILRGRTAEQPVVFDIWDNFSIFQFMNVKRKKYYEKAKFEIIDIPEDKILVN